MGSITGRKILSYKKHGVSNGEEDSILQKHGVSYGRNILSYKKHEVGNGEEDSILQETWGR